MEITYKIHPGIGIARIGSNRDPSKFADSFFIGPEFPGRKGIERTQDLAPTYRFINNYKDQNGDIKRQGARFRVFKYEDGKTPIEVTPQMGTVRWRVGLANTKGSSTLVQNTGPKGELDIVAEFPDLQGFGKVQKESKTGKFRGIPVPVGELHTDPSGRLIVLGGLGRSGSSKANAGLDNLHNKDWYDDVSDGPVDAWVTIEGQEHQAQGAWVIVAPPDFAPEIDPLVSLYDIARDIAVSQWEQEGKPSSTRWLKKPDKASYQSDIFPLIRSVQRTTYVDGDDFWRDVSQLTGSFWVAGSAPLKDMADALEVASGKFNGNFRYTGLQAILIDMWKNGQFIDDRPSPLPPNANDVPTPLDLDVAALSACIGSSFQPGIEASKLMGVPEISSEPFRLSRNASYKNPDTGALVTRLEPGALTQDPSVPWQADFYACGPGWWPVQRPSKVSIVNGPKANWTDGVNSGADLVKNFSRLGFVKYEDLGVAKSYYETERDPHLPRTGA
jgi:hypothetical protein